MARLFWNLVIWGQNLQFYIRECRYAHLLSKDWQRLSKCYTREAGRTDIRVQKLPLLPRSTAVSKKQRKQKEAGRANHEIPLRQDFEGQGEIYRFRRGRRHRQNHSGETPFL